MLIVHVHVHVKPESLAAFKAATLVNARLSRLEPGVLDFDVIQQADDPAKFVFIEIYRDAAAAVAHKETPHYPVWRDTVAPHDGRAARQREIPTGHSLTRCLPEASIRPERHEF